MNDFKPMLAGKAPDDLSKLKYPVLASPKLDGIRCVKLDGRALSRNLKPIPNEYVRKWVEANLPDGIDGELTLHDSTAPFAEVTSAIMSEDGEPDFAFRAFDLLTIRKAAEGTGWADFIAHAMPFVERFGSLEELADAPRPVLWGGVERLHVVPHHLCRNAEELAEQVEAHVLQGFEGTMVRSVDGTYKFGRSTTREGLLLKIKAFEDDEATVVGVFEEMENTNEAKRDELGRTKRSTALAGKVGKGTLGGFHCRMADGTEFDLGGGFTAAQRKELWIAELGRELDGRLVKFKHQPPPGGRLRGVAPRFPVFLGFRHEGDL